MFVCVITQNEHVVAVANDDDALESGKGHGDPGQACFFPCNHNFSCEHNDI